MDLIDVIKKLYADKFGTNIPLYAVDVKSLKQFTTCEKLAKKGISRIPPTHFRKFDEDLISESP
jgi:hypothetical protein